MSSEHLAELVRLLYPEAQSLQLPGAASPSPSEPLLAEYLLVPHARRPKLALPVGPRQTRMAAVRHLPRPRAAGDRLRLVAVRTALGMGGGAFRDRVHVYGDPAADSLPAHLSAALGQPVTVSLHVGGALRANRKPVVEVLGAGGESIGFAKLGVNELTRELVRAEAAALTTLGRANLRSAVVPAVRYAGQWRGHELLVQEALPVWRRPAPVNQAIVERAMVEVTRATGTLGSKLGASDYRVRLGDRLDAVAARTSATNPKLGPALRAAGLDLFATAETTALTFGNWHGDWTPWNTHQLASTVLVWDWERFTQGVPVGFDALHCRMHGAIDSGIAPAVAAQALPGQAPGLLAQFGVGAGPARLTALLYLLDLAARYLADRLDEGTQRLSKVGDWLLPVVQTGTARPNWGEEN